MEGQKTEADDGGLAGHKDHQPCEGGIHEAVGMEHDAEHVDAEPGEARDDIAEDRQVHDSAVASDAAPTDMQNNGIPNHNQQGAVFFRVPAPESAPGLVGPNAAE